MIKKLRQSKLLVIEVFHFKIIVSIVNKKGKSFHTVESVKRNSVFPLEAIVQCLDELRSKCNKLPSHAICLTTDAQAGIVNLKEEAEEAHTSLQIQWEMENSILPAIPALELESLIQFEGFLNRNQYEQLIAQELDKAIIAESFSQRLLDAEIFDDDHIEEIQYFLDGRPEFNDVDNYDSNLIQNDKVKGKNYSCTASASQHKMEMSILLKSQKINLVATLPWSLSSINEELLTDAKNGLYIEEHPSYWLLVEIKKSRFISQQITQRLPEKFPEDFYTYLNDETYNYCQFVSSSFNLTEIQNKLQRSVPLEEIKTTGNALIKTAAKITWNQDGIYKPAPATISLPPIPLKEKPTFWWSLGVACCVIYSGAFLYDLNQQKTDLEKQSSKVTEEIKKIEKKIKNARLEVKKAKELTAKQEKLIQENDYLKKISSLKQPGNFVKDLLSIIKTANIQGLKIKKIIANDLYQFKISGLALSQTTPHKLSSLITAKYKNLSPLITISQLDRMYTFDISISDIELKP